MDFRLRQAVVAKAMPARGFDGQADTTFLLLPDHPAVPGIALATPGSDPEGIVSKDYHERVDIVYSLPNSCLLFFIRNNIFRSCFCVPRQ